MSYASAAALQVAIFAHLKADSALSAMLGDALYDTLPSGPLPPLYAVIGAEDVKDRSDMLGGGGDHRFVLSIISTEPRFKDAKTVATLISDALVDAAPDMTSGRIVTLRFLKARARRTRSDGGRRIDLTFRAIVEHT